MEDLKHITYEQFRDALKEPKYLGSKCFVAWCDNPAEFNNGSGYGYCEECAEIKKKYDLYMRNINKQIRIRKMWGGPLIEIDDLDLSAIENYKGGKK